MPVGLPLFWTAAGLATILRYIAAHMRTRTIFASIAVTGALFALVPACSSNSGDEPSTATTTTTSDESLSLLFNPCDPRWQLPTYARYNPSTDLEFKKFEDRLQAGNSLWIGSFYLPYPYRAIVEVDHYLAGVKAPPRDGLWYLAAIPITSTDAYNAVSDFAGVDPVDSRLLGYCCPDHTFQPNLGYFPKCQVGTPNYYVTEYDPRCVCSPESARMTPSVGPDLYYSVPVY
jgi:hypothetical protein